MITLKQLSAIVCEVCQVEWQLVLFGSQKAELVMARHLYSFFAYTEGKVTYSAIARSLYYKHHSSVYRGKKLVDDMIEFEDSKYTPVFKEIENRISALK